MTLNEKEVHWYRNDGSKPTPRRKALNRADEFDNRGQNDRANKIRRLVISKDYGDHHTQTRKKARDIKVDDNKVGKLPTAAKSDKRGAIDVKHNLKKLKEVAPPGYGHTKGDKEKGVKKGGTAAAFDKARKEGRFKGSKSDMFAIMWSQKNKGDKPHYKPGTNKKFKKYQDESFEIDSKAHKKVQRQAKIRNLAKGNENPNEKSAAERKLKGPKLVGEAKKLKDNNIPQKERKNINYRYKNLHKQDLTGTVGEEVSRRNKPSAIKKKKTLEKLLIDKEVSKIQKESTMKKEMTYQEAIDAGWEMSGEGIWMPPQTETVTEKISFPSFKKKVAERKPEKAQDAGAKARRAMKRREHAKYVSGSEDIVPDDIRD